MKANADLSPAEYRARGREFAQSAEHAKDAKEKELLLRTESGHCGHTF
jgi:hypothetical protein